MKDWKPVSLGDLGTVVTGRTPPAKSPEAFGSDFPFITPTDMDGRRYIDRTERWISDVGAAAMSRLCIPPRSVMVSCIGWQLGKVAMTTRESFTNQQLNTVIPDRSKVDPLFLYYHLLTRRAEIRQLASGGTRTPILNKSRFEALPVLLPPMDAQSRVGEILGCLDSLIETNQRQVVLLEEAARTIHQEWVIHGRFAGHGELGAVDSSPGSVPNGWHRVRLGQIAALDRSGVQPAASPDEVFNHYSIAAFDAGKLPVAEAGSTIRSAKYLLSSSAVLVSKLNPRFERTWLVCPEESHRCVASTEFLVLRPLKSMSLEFLYLTIRSDAFQDRMRALSGGTSASHQRVKPDDFLAIDVAATTPEIVSKFTAVVSPVLALVEILRVQNRQIALLRDSLLPKLVAGQIDVCALDLGTLIERSVA